jgi:hypothetical protein
MSPLGITFFVLVIVAVDGLIVWALFRTFSQMWRELSRRFPPFDPTPGAVHKRRQSFRVNLMNMSKCVHVAVDEAALHLRPARFARWFGARDCSVPWEQVRIKKIGRWWGVAEVGNVTLSGPAWCLKLAPGPDEPPPSA